jgi:hypothetical protein
LLEITMDIRPALKSQYHAALKTLRAAIEKCPDNLWNDPADQLATFWRVVYHTLFFTHLYLQQDHNDFTPWSGAREEAQCLDGVPWDNHRPPKPCEPYTHDEMLEYWQACDAMVDSRVDALDLSAAKCGFHWYQMGTLEHQFVNLRHIQHHAAILSHRLHRSAGIRIDWVAKE